MDVQGKVIVITGAAQGLGQKMAEIMAGQGADLALVDLDHAKLQETVRLCATGQSQRLPSRRDRRAGGRGVVSDASTSDFGSVDGLINNAGVTSDALLVKAADGKVQRKMSLRNSTR